MAMASAPPSGAGNASSAGVSNTGAAAGGGGANAGGRTKKVRIGVDVDEVLARFLPTLNIFCYETYGLQYVLEQYHVYNFAKVWGCSAEESNRRVHEFFESDHFATGIPPMPGAHESLARLAPTHELVVVTSRQNVIKKPTIAWIEQHFPDTFSEMHFGNHFALEGASKPKSQLCRELGAEVLIDDNPVYALECARAGIDVLLFDLDLAYPWSKTADGPIHPRITRVDSWLAVEKALAARASLLPF